MRRKRLLVIAALLSACLIFPLALGANLINVADLPFLGGPVTSSSPTVFAGPPHVLNETLQAGNKFTVHVNVSDAADLFTWQINIDWNSSILNVSRIVPGEFLARAAENTSSEALSEVLGYDMVINSTDNAQGYSSFSESILGNVTGISGNGTLVSIEFLVLEYGWTNLNISVSGTFPTTLLDSLGSNITFTAVDGYFSNKMLGDVDGNRIVDWFDFGDFAVAFGSKGPPQVPVPDPLYDRQADFDLNGIIDWFDFGDFAVNFGRSI